jgi:hypothetical protein
MLIALHIVPYCTRARPLHPLTIHLLLWWPGIYPGTHLGPLRAYASNSNVFLLALLYHKTIRIRVT